MAEIPVERKDDSGIPWWVWLILAALVAALLIWWLSSDDEGRDPATTEDTVITEPAPAGTPTTNQIQ